MGKTSKADSAKSAKEGRDQRLKAALKANLQRRKAQARARAADDGNDKSSKAG